MNTCKYVVEIFTPGGGFTLDEGAAYMIRNRLAVFILSIFMVFLYKALKP